MTLKILFVEDEDRLRNILLESARLDGYSPTGVPSAEEGLALLKKERFDLLVTDVNLPGMSGLDLLQKLPRPITTIVITAYGSIDIAVEAMKRGARDFIVKPFELATLSSAIRVATGRVIEQSFNPRELDSLGIITESASMQKLFDQVKAIAPFDTTVLVTGETGTGKELVARALHSFSQRKSRPLIALNCAAVPEQLLEDELFGHVKGAFTGAQTAREGRFEQADGGTLFLDEIADMSHQLQSKLLRILQEREFEKLGSSRTIKVDVRIVAATSADLEQRMEDGTFRPDLYYRLNVVHLRLPPLRERKEAIRPLATHLLSVFCENAKLPQKSIGDDVWPALQSYRWPGNVRQLENAMQRAAAMSGPAREIHLEDLPEEVRGGSAYGISPVTKPGAATEGGPDTIPDEGLNFEAVVTEVERELLLQSLNKSGGNKMQAAKLLNMKRTTFVEKLKRLQLE